MAYERKIGEPLTVEFVPSATVKPLVFVKDTDPLERAWTQMELHNFSQLPVLRGRTPVGVISWESIGRALVRNSAATLKDCMDDGWQKVRLDDELLPIIPTVNQRAYVVVVDGRDQVTGVVTGADLGELLVTIAEPFLELESIETTLREIVTKLRRNDLISAKMITEVLPTSAKPSDREAEDFTFGELRQIICSERVWPSLNSAYDRLVLLDHLTKAVEVRNRLMHFRTLTKEDKETLLRLSTLRKIMIDIRDG